MKWLPEPSVPSCSRQFGAIASALSAPSVASSSSIRALRATVSRSLRCTCQPTAARPARSTRAAGQGLPRGQVAVHQAGADGDHSAADVNADRGGHDRAERRDHRPDGGALSEMRVRHKCQMRPDERHRRGPPGLRLVWSSRIDAQFISFFASCSTTAHAFPCSPPALPGASSATLTGAARPSTWISAPGATQAGRHRGAAQRRGTAGGRHSRRSGGCRRSAGRTPAQENLNGQVTLSPPTASRRSTGRPRNRRNIKTESNPSANGRSRQFPDALTG